MSRITLRMQTTYVPRPDRDERLSSAIHIAQWLSEARDLYERHRRELLSIACWKATELDGKWNTRYRSSGVVTGSIGTPVNHEHVVTREILVTAMYRNPDSCEVLLTNAANAACLVTKAEHAVMKNGSAFGWDRYSAASIEVIDMLDMSQLGLQGENRRLRKAIGPLLVDR